MRILVRLGPVTHPRVHRMPRLMGQRVDIRQHILPVVRQDVGWVLVTPTGESSAPLSPVFIAVHPTRLAQAIPQDLLVLTAQGSARRRHQLRRLLKLRLPLRRRHQRHLQVRRPQLLQTQHLLP